MVSAFHSCHSDKLLGSYQRLCITFWIKSEIFQLLLYYSLHKHFLSCCFESSIGHRCSPLSHILQHLSSVLSRKFTFSFSSHFQSNNLGIFWCEQGSKQNPVQAGFASDGYSWDVLVFCNVSFRGNKVSILQGLVHFFCVCSLTWDIT